MKFIDEKILDAAILELEQYSDDPEYIVTRLQEENPVVFSFLLSESFDLLTDLEKEEMFYIALVLLQSAKLGGIQSAELNEELLEIIEEENWEKIVDSTDNAFHHRINIFFDNYPQEDMLAFVEDMLVEDEDSLATKEGREPMFIALKTVIDAICGIR
jgi:hypothetical protein